MEVEADRHRADMPLSEASPKPLAQPAPLAVEKPAEVDRAPAAAKAPLPQEPAPGRHIAEEAKRRLQAQAPVRDTRTADSSRQEKLAAVPASPDAPKRTGRGWRLGQDVGNDLLTAYEGW
jgi:hypothetical protein